MEGNYYFEWKVIRPTGISYGIYSQAFYGKDLQEAVKAFTETHGALSPDEDGNAICITALVWQP